MDCIQRGGVSDAGAEEAAAAVYRLSGKQR